MGHLPITPCDIFSAGVAFTRIYFIKSKNLINISANMNFQKHSLLPHTLNNWNNLLNEVTEVSNISTIFTQPYIGTLKLKGILVMRLRSRYLDAEIHVSCIGYINMLCH